MGAWVDVVGILLGVKVGVGVGGSVGVTVGDGVGGSVGVTDGDTDVIGVVGTSVGVTVGDGDGGSVGVTEGSAVGASETKFGGKVWSGDKVTFFPQCEQLHPHGLNGWQCGGYVSWRPTIAPSGMVILQGCAAGDDGAVSSW
jgi:hypothetical protein